MGGWPTIVVGIDGVVAHRDGLDVEDREVVGERVVARVVAERPLPLRLALLDVALDDDLGVRGHHDVVRDRLHDLDRLAAQDAAEQVLLDHRRARSRRREDRDRVGAQRDGDGEPVVPGVEPLAHVRGTVVMLVDVHAGRLRVEDLHPVHADVVLALEVLRHHQRQRDERAAVLGPRGQHGQRVQVDVVAAQNDLLTRGLLDLLGTGTSPGPSG